MVYVSLVSPPVVHGHSIFPVSRFSNQVEEAHMTYRLSNVFHRLRVYNFCVLRFRWPRQSSTSWHDLWKSFVTIDENKHEQTNYRTYARKLNSVSYQKMSTMDVVAT